MRRGRLLYSKKNVLTKCSLWPHLALLTAFIPLPVSLARCLFQASFWAPSFFWLCLHTARGQVLECDCILAIPPVSCVTLDKLLNLSVPHFLHL